MKIYDRKAISVDLGGIFMKTTKNDHRTRVTKAMIRKAFTTILRNKPIQSISIKELCELAQINRSTFYFHYTDIYDLLNQIEEEMFEGIKTALEPIVASEEGNPNYLTVTTGIFQCIKDNADLCIVTLGNYGDKAFAMKLIDYGRTLCVENYGKFYKNATPQKLEYYYTFVSAGCIGLLQKWFEDGLVMTPAEIASMAENLMMYGMGFLENDRKNENN